MIVGIGGVDVRWMGHEEVVALVRVTGDSLALRLVTPMDNNKVTLHFTLLVGVEYRVLDNLELKLMFSLLFYLEFKSSPQSQRPYFTPFNKQ